MKVIRQAPKKYDCLYLSSIVVSCCFVGDETVTRNEGISAASFCHQVAALIPGMFCNFHLAKNHKFANNSATTEAGEK
jgi:hypothetical protein